MFWNILKGNNSPNLSEVINSNTLLVDVREDFEFASGSVKGAINIPLSQLPNQINKFKGKENIVVFCRSGNRSSQAKSFLESKGINNVYNGGSVNDVMPFVK